MYVADEGKQVIIFVAQDGFMAVLEQVAGAVMAAVVVLGVPGELFSHDCGDAVLAALEQKVYMVIHQSPGVDCAFTLRDGLAESFEEPDLVFIVSEYVRFVDPPDHDVVKGAGNV